MKTHSCDDNPSEMDRFSDEQLTSTFYNPKFANLLKFVLEPIALDKNSNNAIRDADEGVKLLRDKLSIETDPLFFDWHFVYTYIRYWKNHNFMQDQIQSKFSDPMLLMMHPAWLCLSYDYKKQSYRDYPLDNWIKAAESVNWEGVLPTDRVYVDEYGETRSFTSMAALATSPIWYTLGILPYDFTKIHPFPLSRDNSSSTMLFSVGRKQLQRLCEKHNLPDYLPQITAIAKAMKNAKA